jgi:type VI secretion system protein ImpL
MKALGPRLQIVANVAGAALLVWLAAPLLTLNGQHPFDAHLARAAALAGIALLALAVWALVRWIRRQRNARLLQQLQGGSAASEVLAERFANALHLLRSGIGSRGAGKPKWWQRRRHVYQLPWYVFIGAPGAGKTTALLHSGLRFPLAERLGTAPVAGIGGTRQCDWWFTDQAVFIDTAGRYTTQDSHAATDAQEWLLFLKLLRRYRPVQPINGVIVTVSVPDLLQGGAELEHQANAVERRLQELRDELGMSFPVYLLVTKVDLLAGFVEFFGDYDATQREQPWGITFELPASDAAQALPVDLGAQLAALSSRIAAVIPQRLQTEPLLQRRAAIHHFAAQVEAMLPALEAFAGRAFRSSAAAPRQIVRGIHLSSGTQEGNPIDRVLGELSRSYGIALRATPRSADSGKAYFLAGLLQHLVIAEAPLAGTNLARRRRLRWLAAGAGIALCSVLLLACVAWLLSYRNNLDYVNTVRDRVEKVMAGIDPAKGGQIDQLLPLYALLNQLASSGTIDPSNAPWSLNFGLFQGPRLARSADQTYHRVLDRTLAPLLVQRLTQALRQESDPAARYDALRISLMLTTPERLQRAEVRRWAAQAFSAAGPTTAAAGRNGLAPGAGEQQEWLRHLDALLERNAVLDVMRLDEATVRAARTALASMPLERRVHDRLLRRARAQLANDQTLAELASPAAVLAFAPHDAAAGIPAIPAVYTRRAWREIIEPAIEPTIAELADEAGWVMGDTSPAMQRLIRERAAREPLMREVAVHHAQATIAPWDKLLSGLALQLPGDSESLARFGIGLAAPESPLRQLLRRIASEFPPPSTPATSSPATIAFDTTLNEHFGSLRDYALGSGAVAVDRLVVPLAAAVQEPAGARATELNRDLRAEASRAPPPLREMWTGLADAIGAQQKRALERQVVGGLTELSQACRRLTAERFPFASDAKRDMPMADFARVFGPRGLLESFFRAHLASQVDTQHRPWRLTGASAMPDKAVSTLRSFEMADDIRRLFFPAGSELPQLRLQLTPAAMDSELLMFSADVDGQLLRYENGPRRPKPVVWPGPAAQQRVLLRILPAGPSGVGAEVHEGPWALLRVLQQRGWQRGSGSAAQARLEVDGRSLSVDVSSDAPVPAALLGELNRFRCPEPW